MTRTALPKPEQVPADSKPTLDMFTKTIGVHSRFDGDLRGEPARVQRMGHPARLFEESFATT